MNDRDIALQTDTNIHDHVNSCDTFMAVDV